MKLKVVVADDNPAVLRELVSLLEAEFDVVSTAENGQLAFEYARRNEPDIVVLDLEMPLLNGIEVTRKLRKLGRTPAVVICSVESDPEIIEAAQQAGALGYVFPQSAACMVCMVSGVLRLASTAGSIEFFLFVSAACLVPPSGFGDLIAERSSNMLSREAAFPLFGLRTASDSPTGSSKSATTSVTPFVRTSLS